MNDPVSCARCHGSMEPGFIVDHDYGAVAKSEWASGEPKYSHWLGMKMSNRRRYDVITYRCTRCGALESYARDSTQSASE
jgi:hypothetical protein